MANRFSFEADEQQAIILTYQNALEETATETNKFIEKIKEVAEKTKYLQIVKIGKKCIEYYNESIREEVSKLFGEWVDGEASLKSFIKKMEGGEEAEETAERLQTGLEEAIFMMFEVLDSSELDQIDTSEPKLDEKDFDEIKDITVKYKNQLEQVRDENNKIIENRKEENAAYGCIATPISSTLTVVIASFEKISGLVDEVKAEFIERQQAFESVAADLAQETYLKAENDAEEAIAGIAVDFHL